MKKFHKENVQVYVTHGEPLAYEMQVSGNFAMRHVNNRDYSVTHVPSGALVAMYIKTAKKAKEIVRKANEIEDEHGPIVFGKVETSMCILNPRDSATYQEMLALATHHLR